MRTSTHSRWARFAPLLIVLMGPPLPVLSTGTPSEGKDTAAAGFFSPDACASIALRIDTNLFPKLTKSNREYVEGGVIVGTTRLERAGFRLKGWSSFDSIRGRPSFAVKFNEFVSGQQLGGLTKVFLHNSKQDPSCLREALACSLFRDAGVPAPRTRLARVSLNGRDLGAYVVVEAMNKDFLRRNFGNSSGNLYEGFMRDIDGPLEIDNGTDESRADLKALVDAAQQTAGGRWEGLTARLDVERFMTFAALTVFVGAIDGYIFNHNNYRVYHDPVSGKLVFIPHGLDTTFMCGRGITPPTNNILMRSLFGLPQGPELYRSSLWRLATNVWKVETLTNRIAAGLRELLATSSSDTERARWSSEAESLCAQVVTRQQEVLALLRNPEPVKVAFDAKGIACLTNWHPVAPGRSPWFHVVTNQAGVFLQVDAPRPATGSWRTRVSLPEGSYTFSCRARAEARPGPPGAFPAGAISLSGPSPIAAIVKGGQWEELQLRFKVPSEGLIVEPSCDFLSGTGQVLFDLRSCKLVREQ